MALTRGPREGICSARGCVEPAQWAVVWKNPKIPHHREKTWLACESHRDFLHSYLAYRSFPVRDVAFADFLAQRGE